MQRPRSRQPRLDSQRDRVLRRRRDRCSRGAARVGMKVSGTRAAPRVEGKLDLEGAALRVRGFPHGLEAVRGTVQFT